MTLRFATLGQYTTWELLTREWKEGIQLWQQAGGATGAAGEGPSRGVQQKSSAGFKSEKEPWRRGIKDRTAIMDRKDVMYGILKVMSRRSL
ncbi:TPA: hypothetical protein ACH3X1_000021 [Trebouxia sp. C0004]